jgi:prepilin-type N-terminal cleavage/methylation domain-containing protein
MKYELKANTNYAFTLAEVLIALVVIGIVAAITVPVLLQKYQEQAIKSALKKNYSVLKSALDKYQVENGVRLLPSDTWGNYKLKLSLMKYLNVAKDCGIGYKDASIECIHNDSDEEKRSKVYKTYNGKSEIDLGSFDDGQFVLSDGSLILVNVDVNGQFVSVDVNGMNKKPNRLGKDLFMFQFTDKGELLPMGAKGTKWDYCSDTLTNNRNGAGCTAKVLRD